MNTTTMDDSKRDLTATALAMSMGDKLEEPWFSEPPPSSRSSYPPSSAVIRVGEFLGDPEVDAWLR